MLQTVDLGRSSLAAYRGLAPDGILDELERLGRELRGLRVLRVSATSYGGGVSELLRSTVPLLNDLGLVAEWRIIAGDDALFRATKRIHNGLRSWIERGAQLTDPVDGHGATPREVVTRLAAPRGDHGQHEDPALADQRLIGAGIECADLDRRPARVDGRMGDVELDWPAATRLEVDEQQPAPRPEHVARVRLAVQQLLGRTSVDDRAAHRSQRRANQLAIGAGDLRVVGGIIDQALRLVDSIHEVRQPVAAHIRLAHAGVQPLEPGRVLIRRDVVRRHAFVVGPQRDREVVLLVDARFDPRIESRQRGAGLGHAPSDVDLELGAVLP
jgi:hypothetical protein